MPTMKKIQTLHFLRGIFTILVVFAHVNTSFSSCFHGLFIQGWSGVDFFFVLSGFLIVYTDKTTLVGWIKKRIIRIFPPLWVYTLFVVMFTTFIYPVVDWVDVNGLEVAKSLLCVPMPMPVLATAWTLPYELLFYAASTMLFVKGRKPYIVTLFVWGGAIIIYNSFFYETIGTSLISFMFSPFYLEFMFGVLIAYTKDRMKKEWANVFVIIGTIFATLSWLAYTFGFWEKGVIRICTFGIPYSILILGIVINNEKYDTISVVKSRIYNMLGEASYSIYLTHYVSSALIAKITYYLRIKPYISFFIDSSLCILIGVLAYKWVERPLKEIIVRTIKA